MPPLDVAMSERQRAVAHLQMQLTKMNQPQDKAGSMAAKVEEAAYNKANNKTEYMQFLQNSMKKAQAAMQRQQAQQVHNQAQQAQQQQQQQYMQQQQQAVAMAQQQQQQYMQQQAQAQAQAQQAAAPQYMQQQAPQQQYVQQPPVQQQYVQQQAPQYVQQAAPQQQFVRPPQAQYVQQAPQQQQYMQHQQQQYMQQQPGGQPQYLQQAAQQPQYMQQPAAQQQYVQQQPQYMQQQAQQQQQQQQQAQQPQYMQQQAQQQPHQAQYMQQPGGGAVPAQYVPVQMSAQQHAQQQYMQQAGGGGYPAQQYTSAVPTGVPVQQQPAAQQQVPQQQQQAAAQPGGPGIQPRQLGPGEIGRLPSFDDPAFGDFAAEFFPDSAHPMKQQAAAQQQQQAAVQQQQQRVAAMQAQQAQQQQQQQRYMPALQQPPQTQPQPSVAESSVPAGRAGSPGMQGSQAAPREASSAQRRALQHDPASLQEFLRMHTMFNNNPTARAVNVKDSERMLQFYKDTAKTQPASAERMGVRVQRYTMVLRLLTTEKPHQQISITDQVVKLTKTFLKELSQFKEMVKNTRQKLAASGSGATSGATTGGPTTGSAPSPAGGFLAMLESGDSDAMKLPVPFHGSAGAAGTAGVAGAAAGKPPIGPPAAAPTQVPAQHAAAQLQQAQAPGASQVQAPAQGQAATAAAASAAAEAARQQALARQRALAEANAEQQRRRDAAAAAAAALPAGGPQRLLAVAQQARDPQDAAAVQSGYRRLQKVLVLAAEQRQLAPSPAQGVSTPPLPDEVQRLVARERAALEEAAAAEAPGGAAQGTSTAVLTVPSGEGRVLDPPAQQPPGGSDAAADGPAAKRLRSASPEGAALAAPAAASVGAGAGGPQQQQQQRGRTPRQRSELEQRLVAECEEAGAALGGTLLLHVAPDGMDPSNAIVTCLPKSAQPQAAPPGSANSGPTIKHHWQVLLLRVPPAYPAEAPTAVFPRMGQGGASEAQAAAAARHQQLLDACRERFAAALAAVGPEPPRLQQIARAWVEATQHVAGLAGTDGSDGGQP